jgi:hypothetical protein
MKKPPERAAFFYGAEAVFNRRLRRPVQQVFDTDPV